MKSYTISITLSINAESESEACSEAAAMIRDASICGIYEMMEVKKDYEFGIDSTTFYLEQLPEPYRTKALRNYSKKRSLSKPTCLASALTRAFVWRDTEEGFEFWHAVLDYCLYNSPLPEA